MQKLNYFRNILPFEVLNRPWIKRDRAIRKKTKLNFFLKKNFVLPFSTKIYINSS